LKRMTGQRVLKSAEGLVLLKEKEEKKAKKYQEIEQTKKDRRRKEKERLARLMKSRKRRLLLLLLKATRKRKKSVRMFIIQKWKICQSLMKLWNLQVELPRDEDAVCCECNVFYEDDT